MYNYAPELDHNIKSSIKNMGDAEDTLSHRWGPEENVQLGDDPICSTAGCTQYTHPKKDRGYPIDYFVPSFGADPEIAGTAESLAEAESIVGTNWDFTFSKPPVNPAAMTMYNYAPELDGNMKTSLKNLKEAQSNLDFEWDISAPSDDWMALQTESDPICSSAGCDQYKHPEKKLHPMNYPVPSFGADPEITGINQSLAVAEATTGHKWDFTFAKPPVNAAAKTMYNFAPELDGRIKTSLKNLAQAEDSLDYKWDITKPDDEVTALGLSSDPNYSSLGAEDDKKYKQKKSESLNDAELNDEIRFLQY